MFTFKAENRATGVIPAPYRREKFLTMSGKLVQEKKSALSKES